MSTPFPIEDNDQTRTRREHLERIRELVGNPYPNKFRRTRVVNPDREDTVTAVVEHFRPLVPEIKEGARPAPEELERANAGLNPVTVRVSGRLAVPPRVMGKAAFVHLSDGNERLQIYVRRGDARGRAADGREVDGWELFQLLDHGDFVGVEGFLFVTRTGELSVHVREIEFLAKALLPMPDKMHGISDPEIRQRQRYVDLIAGSLKVKLDDDARDGGAEELTPRQVFERRSRLVTELRRYLDSRGFVEVETPMLTPIASGAAARPFKTHHNALGIDLYARIAPELYLKRLLVGGFERVYELNRNFRNEGLGYRWNPEFTMLEFYCAYMDANGMMDFCEEMLRAVIEKITGGTRVRFGEHELDFGNRLERLSMRAAISKYWSFDEDAGRTGIKEADENCLNDLKCVRRLVVALKMVDNSWARYETDKSFREAGGGVPPDLGSYFDSIAEGAERVVNDPNYKPTTPEEADIGKGIEFLFERVVEPNLSQPTFIHDYPKIISPLSKASPSDPTVAERFELFVPGMELGNGFSELNDPVEQYERFEEQVRQRERGDEEAMPMDVDYVRALGYGMPPAAGIGIGVDRLAMLLTNRRSIRDVILFPHMRPRAGAGGAESAEAAAGQPPTDPERP